MSTTGTTLFNLDVNDLIEEAFERCGKESRSGYDFKTARRSLNLLTIEWANRGINLWTVEQGVIPMVTGQAMYPLANDTIDLMDTVIRQNNGTLNQIDINISRIAEPTYMSLPNKLAQGRPIQVWINRQTGATYPDGASTVIKYPQINIWPTPDQGTEEDPYYHFIYWRLRRIQDAGNAVNTQDIPFRLLNALVAGLASYLSMKLQGVDPNRIQMLKADYEQQLDLALSEDREKASIRFVPRNMSYTR